VYSHRLGVVSHLNAVVFIRITDEEKFRTKIPKIVILSLKM